MATKRIKIRIHTFRSRMDVGGLMSREVMAGLLNLRMGNLFLSCAHRHLYAAHSFFCLFAFFILSFVVEFSGTCLFCAFLPNVGMGDKTWG